MFTLESTDSQARSGTLHTMHGTIKTPVFMPVATRGAIKAGVGFDDLKSLGAQISLGNTYHLHLKPTSELIRKMGGLHHWERWDKPILTDSGGFQVFSIQNKKITDSGVWFRSHINGDRFYLDAETSLQIQINLGSDIVMAFDECPPSRLPERYKNLSPKEYEKKLFDSILNAVHKTTSWAKRSLQYFSKQHPLDIPSTHRPQIFGIIQGGCFSELRHKSLKEITQLNFDGFAMGGLAVGEPPKEMYAVLDEMVPHMPRHKPRYLMGVGTPLDLIEAVERGIDMFDCVLPARNARHGMAYTSHGPIKLTQARFRTDESVLDPYCTCAVCSTHQCSKSYLHHLLKVGEDLGKRYLTIHNLHFYQSLMAEMRNAIEQNNWKNWKKGFLEKFLGGV